MSRIQQRFECLREEGRRALVSFVTAGDPVPSVTVPLMHVLVAAGADIIELGVPFSDPMADGPVIQRSSERALAQQITLLQVLKMVAEFRERDRSTPVVLMGYLNPVEAMGYAIFARTAADVGVDGVITVDLPPEEADALVQALHESDIDPIYLVAPTSDAARIARICAQARGFVYYVSIKGVTGSANLDVTSVAEKVAMIKAVTDLPVGVGFGIKDAESAARVAAFSDAVVVGSVLVQRMEHLVHRPNKILDEVPAIIARMREAMDHALRAHAS